MNRSDKGDLRRSLFQPPAQRGIRYESRPGCSRFLLTWLQITLITPVANTADMQEDTEFVLLSVRRKDKGE